MIYELPHTLKLSKKHLDWKNMKMKVRLAAEVLSSSVADALEYLSIHDPRFKDAGATIEFIRKVRINFIKKVAVRSMWIGCLK